MHKLKVALVLLAMLSSPAFSQKISPNSTKIPTAPAGASDEVCARLAKFVQTNLKEIALQRMLGSDDTSAIRASNRLLTEVASITAIQTTLTQMVALKCSVPEEPVDPDRYFPDALACAAARSSAVLTPSGVADKIKAACNKDNWKPVY